MTCLKNEKSYGLEEEPRGSTIFQRWAEEEESLHGPEKQLSGRKEGNHSYAASGKHC